MIEGLVWSLIIAACCLYVGWSLATERADETVDQRGGLTPQQVERANKLIELGRQ